MASVKSHVFVSLLVVLPPLIYTWTALDLPNGNIKHISITSLTIWGLIYAWLFNKIAYPHFFGALRHFPRPTDDVFALGHGPRLMARPPGVNLIKWMRTVPNEGIIAFTGLFHLSIRLLATTPEAISDVLNTNAYDWEKPAPPKAFLASVLGEGILLVEGKEHKVQRRTVWPAFQGKHIRNLVPLFWSKSSEFVDVVAKDMMNPTTALAATTPNTGTIEISEPASRATLDIIGVAGLGRDFATLQDSGDELAGIFGMLTDPTSSATRFYFMAHLFLPTWIIPYLPVPSFIKLRNAAKRLRTICIGLLAEKRATMAEKSIDKPDIISILLNSASMSDDELTDQLLTFLAAGHETTASATTWASYMIATHPEIQARLRDEVRTQLAKNDGQIDADALDAMPYLSAVCSETLRFWPTVPSTGRVAIRPTTVAGHAIPKGTVLFMAMTATNRLESLWGPDAGVFNPDRWLAPAGADATAIKERANKGGSPSVYNNITFLHGPRSCIGQGFAQSELKCLVAALVDRFDMKMANPDEEIMPAGIITVKPQNGLHLLLTDLKA